MGLGTFLVRTLAEQLGGRLTFESTPQTGTLATFELPLLLKPRPNPFMLKTTPPSWWMTTTFSAIGCAARS